MQTWRKPIVTCKKPIKLLIDPEDLEDTPDKGRPVSLMGPSPQEMDEFEKEEIKKSRSLVKNKLNKWYDWLVDHVPKPVKNTAGKKICELKNNIIRLYDGVKKTLNGQTVDNTAYENKGDVYYTRTEIPFNSLMTGF